MNDFQLQSILADIDMANSADPNKEACGDKSLPREFLYGQRMSAWLGGLRPDADAALQIAARAQHICRWERPRDSYPMDRRGYLAWRRDLYDFHAEKVAKIIRSHGGGEDLLERVSFLLHKKQLHDDPDTQTLEDVACLVFLEFHLAEFAARTEREKMKGIIRKTWRKMSDEGHSHAMNLDLPESVRTLLGEALDDG